MQVKKQIIVEEEEWNELRKKIDQLYNEVTSLKRENKNETQN